MSIKKHYLLPGELYVSLVPMEITTVLGSCVSVCLYDSVRKIGGINHYLLPGGEDDARGDASKGSASIALLLRMMLNSGCIRENLEAKIFGGSSSVSADRDRYAIGQRNIAMAVDILGKEGIPLTARNTGGMQGRKIIFLTTSGKVTMQLLPHPIIIFQHENDKGSDH
ncbi:MAG TPA: chemotaxis protein CheD [Ohtaekwangia sp.]|uniref:chemotaxis protein CheD n=1 Tax=Ohtaekwangia sp. TaxID=2066019 RepID=UPI002F959197